MGRISEHAPIAKLSGTRLNEGSIVLKQVLGRGGFGVVYEGQQFKPPQAVAVKALVDGTPRERRARREEIRLHLAAASGNRGVVAIHEILSQSDYTFIVMDRYPGTLRTVMRHMSSSMRRHTFLQLIDAVAHCHRNGVYHRDLKPDNILVSRDGRRVVIADFGLATNKKTSSTFCCGTREFMSPECLDPTFDNRGSYETMRHDIWALGIILVQLEMQVYPWEQASKTTCEQFFTYTLDPDHYFLQNFNITTEAQSLLRRLFSLTPSHRPSLSDLRHRFKKVRVFTVKPLEAATIRVATSCPPLDSTRKKAIHTVFRELQQEIAAGRPQVEETCAVPRIATPIPGPIITKPNKPSWRCSTVSGAVFTIGTAGSATLHPSPAAPPTDGIPTTPAPLVPHTSSTWSASTNSLPQTPPMAAAVDDVQIRISGLLLGNPLAPLTPLRVKPDAGDAKGKMDAEDSVPKSPVRAHGLLKGLARLVRRDAPVSAT